MTLVAIDVFLALSVLSALAWSDARGIYAGTEYIREAKAALAVADRDAPLLPQVLPPQVADPRLAPLNRTDIVFAPLPDRPDFATWTTDLRAFDGKGTLQPASLEGIDVSVACTSWAPGITLAQELPEFTYVVSIQLPAPSPAGFVVQLGQGPPATVPAGVGAATVYTQVSGSGSVLLAAAGGLGGSALGALLGSALLGFQARTAHALGAALDQYQMLQGHVAQDKEKAGQRRR